MRKLSVFTNFPQKWKTPKPEGLFNTKMPSCQHSKAQYLNTMIKGTAIRSSYLYKNTSYAFKVALKSVPGVELSKYLFIQYVPRFVTLYTNPRIHLFHIQQCSIQNWNVRISVLYWALWDLDQVYSGICWIVLRISFRAVVMCFVVVSLRPSDAYMRR